MTPCATGGGPDGAGAGGAAAAGAGAGAVAGAGAGSAAGSTGGKGSGAGGGSNAVVVGASLTSAVVSVVSWSPSVASSPSPHWAQDQRTDRQDGHQLHDSRGPASGHLLAAVTAPGETGFTGRAGAAHQWSY